MNELWSLSRENLLNSCPRAFHLQYKSSIDSWRPESDDCKDLYLLRKTITASSWTRKNAIIAFKLLLQGNYTYSQCLLFIEKEFYKSKSLILNPYIHLIKEAQEIFRTFCKSDFYQTYHKSTQINLITSPAIKSFQHADYTIHLTWDFTIINRDGSVDIVLISDKNPEQLKARISLISLYHLCTQELNWEKLRFYQLKSSRPKKLQNITIDWQDIAQLKEKIITFNQRLKERMPEIHITLRDKKHCSQCSFYEVCPSFDIS